MLLHEVVVTSASRSAIHERGPEGRARRGRSARGAAPARAIVPSPGLAR
ncbi:hypothetical protein WMF11_30345 [Sorangium sp. So ce295]